MYCTVEVGCAGVVTGAVVYSVPDGGWVGAVPMPAGCCDLSPGEPLSVGVSCIEGTFSGSGGGGPTQTMVVATNTVVSTSPLLIVITGELFCGVTSLGAITVTYTEASP
jgi:hypothetical protein